MCRSTLSLALKGFPSDEIVCDAPIKVMNYKLGVCSVAADGKECKTVFTLVRWDLHSHLRSCAAWLRSPRWGDSMQRRALCFMHHDSISHTTNSVHSWCIPGILMARCRCGTCPSMATASSNVYRRRVGENPHRL